MTLHEFDCLTLKHKIWLYGGGIIIGRFETEELIAECRQVEDFYVECEIHISNKFKCIIYCHQDTVLLDRYFDDLPTISLQDLL